MMRVCHLDTCPVGVATQNPELRKRFSGKPEFVVNFFEFIAEEVRELLAQLGFRTIEEAIGHVEVLDTRAAIDHWKAHGLDLTPILTEAENPYEGQTCHCTKPQDHGLDKALDAAAHRAGAARRSSDGEPVEIDAAVRNVNRTVGTMLGSRGHPGAAVATGCPTTRSTCTFAAPPARASVRSCRRASRCGSRATPTTTSARASRAGG